MLMKVFSLHDLKAGTFMQPFFFPSVGQAVRAVLDLATDMGTLVARHPEDFVLYHLGDWDDLSARFADGHPSHIATVVSILETVKKGEPNQ